MGLGHYDFVVNFHMGPVTIRGISLFKKVAKFIPNQRLVFFAPPLSFQGSVLYRSD